MAENTITIEVNGQTLEAEAGQMLIEVTDNAGIDIPRFCYHKNLSIAANCRMCLIEVENAPKPLPACATPCNDGMKVHTQSPVALQAQKGTMEFLLINHPLDCPVCDQGGECELQDVAMGYGGDVSRFVEGKRVVADPNIGPLIATEMTRCIHCTRCVRFGDEIAGVRELGATGRGEHMHIGTYIAKTVSHEMSGNVIDLCPVGALTAKPSQYQARAWELRQASAIATHDSIGSNLQLHLLRNQLIRTVPNENEAINETWISDRDRFAYQGLAHDRALEPTIKRNGRWETSDWTQAISEVASIINATNSDDIAVLANPTASLEELYLLKRMADAKNINSIDTRLRQQDFRLDTKETTGLGIALKDISTLDSMLVIGSLPRKEAPILNHHIRKAAIAGASVSFINPCRSDANYPVEEEITVSPVEMLEVLAGIANALEISATGVIADKVRDAHVSDSIKTIASSLNEANNGWVMSGSIALAHPDYAAIKLLSSLIAEKTGCAFGYLPPASNSVGADYIDFKPRGNGSNAIEMIKGSKKVYLLLNIEPDFDVIDPASFRASLESADKVVALTAYRSESLEAIADVVLPITSFYESSATYVNAEGTIQSHTGSVPATGEAKPGWKVLRVLGNALNIDNFDYDDTQEVLTELTSTYGDVSIVNQLDGDLDNLNFSTNDLQRVGLVPIYRTDATVRRADALQQMPEPTDMSCIINPETAKELGVNDKDKVKVSQSGNSIETIVQIDDTIAENTVICYSAVDDSQKLGCQIDKLKVEKV